MGHADTMTDQSRNYCGYRCPPDIISCSVWLHHRSTLSLGDSEDLLAERGVVVFHESVRRWCMTFALDYARPVRKRYGHLGDVGHMDEVVLALGLYGTHTEARKVLSARNYSGSRQIRRYREI